MTAAQVLIFLTSDITVDDTSSLDQSTTTRSVLTILTHNHHHDSFLKPKSAHFPHSSPLEVCAFQL